MAERKESLKLGVGQATELQMSFRRNGWTNQDVKKLSTGKVSGDVLGFMNNVGIIEDELHVLDNLTKKVNYKKNRYEKSVGGFKKIASIDKQMSPDVNFDSESLKKDVSRVLSTLSETESKFVKFIFGIGCKENEGHCYEQLASVSGLSISKVHEIVAEAIRKLNQICQSKEFLLDYLT